MQKSRILAKNRKSAHKSILWPKVDVCEKTEFCFSNGQKIENVAKNYNLDNNQNFCQKSKFWSKIEILVKNHNFGQKSKFWSKIEILVKNRNFGQKSKFWSKIQILVKYRNFGQKSKFWSRIFVNKCRALIWYQPSRITIYIWRSF